MKAKRIRVCTIMLLFCLLLGPACRVRAEELKTTTMMEVLKKVNVRAEPDTKAESLGQMEQGERLFAVELTQEGWYRVVYQGETGYIRSDFLKIYQTEGWDASEDSETINPGEVINPEEEVKKASEEAERREAEALESAASEAASIAAASEAREQEEAARKIQSRKITAIILIGVVAMIAVYAVYVVMQEREKPEAESGDEDSAKEAAWEASETEETEIKAAEEKMTGNPLPEEVDRLTEGEIEFIDLE